MAKGSKGLPPAVLAFPKPSRRARKDEKKARRRAQGEARSNIRAKVLERSRGRCENPSCRASLQRHGAIMDHWLGGSGRRTQQESVATCWMLCLRCNRNRTDNYPDAVSWNAAFKDHCERNGYDFLPHYVCPF